ncbi:MAG: ABC transporter ATP-binding protein [Bacteroidota bacterium]
MKKLIVILRYAIPYWKYALANIVFNIVAVAFSVVSLVLAIPILNILFKTQEAVTSAPPLSFNPDSIKQNFYYFISETIRNNGEMTALLYICLSMVVLFFLKNLFRYMAMYYLAPVRNGVVKDLRNELYLKIMILPLAFYTEQRKGDIMARMTSDVQEVEWSIMSSLEMIFREPITIIVFLATLFIISPQLTLFILVLLPIAGYLIGQIGRSLKRTSQKGQKKMGELLALIEETISGLRIIKAFNAIFSTQERFKKENIVYTKLMVRLYRKRDLAAPLSEFLAILVIVPVLYVGGKLVLSNDSGMGAAVFITYLGLFSQLLPPAKSFTAAFYNVQKGAASVERIQVILKAEEVIIEKPDAIAVKEFKDEIEFRNVGFQYGNEPVLNNINLKVEKGKMIALVGPSGAGKTTMVDLLPRFYDCSEGQIIIDGHDVKDYVISDLRGLMGIVTQESILFNDSVYNNIAFGMKNVSEQDVIRAAQIANAHDFIMEMENGYQSNIGDRGMKLSGGQKQRISIARAVLKNPPIMILDEATSALDTESERLVQDALMKLMKNRTSVVIAHRLSTIQYSDEIIVIQKGEIVERGNHTELTAKNGVYRKLCDLQAFS